MNRYVIADIHGAHKALVQCLERSGFDKENDQLICLGDTCDGWPDVKECFDELMSIKNLVYVRGNHDQWFLDYHASGVAEHCWVNQGGRSTLKSLSGNPHPYAEFLCQTPFYYVQDDCVFVHGGFDTIKTVFKEKVHNLMWDRSLIQWAYKIGRLNPDSQFSTFKEIYVGHTSTVFFYSEVPLKLGNLWAMDTGAGWEGKLSIMNIGTKEYWQSDRVDTLYKEHNGRSL